MSSWDDKFRALSSVQSASFGAPSLEVSISPTPKPAPTFDLSRVPAPLFLALTVAGLGLACAASYSLGEAYERERHERHYNQGVVKISHVRRKPLLGHQKERAWALREALARTPSGSNYSAVTRRDVG